MWIGVSILIGYNLTHYGPVTSYGYIDPVNIGSRKGLVMSANKSLSQYWLTTEAVLWHLPETNFSKSAYI